MRAYTMYPKDGNPRLQGERDLPRFVEESSKASLAEWYAGVKLPSHAAKEWSGTFADLRRKQEKVEAKLQQVLAQHERAAQEEGEATAPARRAEQQRRQDQLERLEQ